MIYDVVRIDSAVYTEWYDFWRTNAVIGGDKNFQQVWAQLAVENIPLRKYGLITNCFAFTDCFML